MTAKTFSHSHRVTYADCTLGNHVYYGRYLDLLEAARGEFFRSLGRTFLELQQQDTIFPVLECSLKYKAPARYDDVLIIELWLTQLSRLRLTFSYRLLNTVGVLLLEGTTAHVCTSTGEKPKRLPEELAQALAPFLHPLPAPSGGTSPQRV